MIEAVWLPYEQTQTWREELSGVVHADDSMRPLVVDDRSHPFHGLLEAMESRHNAMAVINTSFNNEREPIVETPGDALRTFASSGLDFLVLEDVLLTKPT
jgi:carbamoyltransferase